MNCRTLAPCERLACFDLDHTLLKPLSGKKFAKSRDDAELVFPQVVEKLNALREDGYKIVIFTNQKGNKNINDIYYKIDKLLGAAEIYISTGEDHWRKPSIGMLEECLKNNGPISDIFYVGDAAGRPADFSASDAQFAYNFRIPFYTPEAFFLGEENKYSAPKIVYVNEETSLPTFIDKSVVILIGAPASGKSFLAASLAKKYNFKIINNDSMGKKAVEEYLHSLDSNTNGIIIDNTNPTKVGRAFYITAAKKYNYTVYAIVMKTSKEICNYLNWYRTCTTMSKLIPTVAINTFYKRFEAPQAEERIDFIFDYSPKFKKNIFKYSF